MFGGIEDKESYFDLPSDEIINLNHEPILTINITHASPLHCYTYVFLDLISLYTI